MGDRDIPEHSKLKPAQNATSQQIDRFKETARALGCDEDEAAFEEKLKVIARQKQKADSNSSEPIGWYVRVTNDEVHDGVYNSLLYIVGYPTPADAEAAVRRVRSAPNEGYEVLPGDITAGQGPQPKSGEVRLIKGAV